MATTATPGGAAPEAAPQTDFADALNPEPAGSQPRTSSTGHVRARRGRRAAVHNGDRSDTTLDWSPGCDAQRRWPCFARTSDRRPLAWLEHWPTIRRLPRTPDHSRTQFGTLERSVPRGGTRGAN
jgi:hypothetical protein